MDWSKAKIILIIIFIVLNVFLLSNILFMKMEDQVSEEKIQTALQAMSNKGIVIKGDIPNYAKDTGKLSFESVGYDKGRVVASLLGIEGTKENKSGDIIEFVNGSKTLTFLNISTFEYTNTNPVEKIDVSNRKNAESMAKKLLASFGIPAANYIIDSGGYTIKDDGSIMLELREKYKGFIIFDNYAQISVSPEGITYIKCKYRKVKGFAAGKKSILPAHLILLRHYDAGINSPISSIDFGFIGYSTVRETKESTESPAWRVRLEDGSEAFYKAYDGEKIK